MTQHLRRCLLTGHNFLSCFISWPINLHLDFCLGYKHLNRNCIPLSITKFFVKSYTPLRLVVDEIQTHNLLIFGLTTKPSCLGMRPSFNHSSKHLLLTLECQPVDILTTNANNKKCDSCTTPLCSTNITPKCITLCWCQLLFQIDYHITSQQTSTLVYSFSFFRTSRPA